MLIIHGDNLVLSRQRLIDELGRFQGEIIRLEGSSLDLTQLKQALESTSLFGQPRLVVIENLFSQRPSEKKTIFLNYLKKFSGLPLLLWEGKTIDGRVLRSFQKAKIAKFQLSPLLFKFLDSLTPKNKKTSLLLLHQILPKDPPELVFYLLCRRIKDLIIAADLGKEGLGQMAPWQKAKLIYQAKNWELTKLIKIYDDLLRIDTEQKTGQSALPLSSQLDLFLTSL